MWVEMHFAVKFDVVCFMWHLNMVYNTVWIWFVRLSSLKSIDCQAYVCIVGLSSLKPVCCQVWTWIVFMSSLKIIWMLSDLDIDCNAVRFVYMVCCNLLRLTVFQKSQCVCVCVCVCVCARAVKIVNGMSCHPVWIWFVMLSCLTMLCINVKMSMDCQALRFDHQDVQKLEYCF